MRSQSNCRFLLVPPAGRGFMVCRRRVGHNARDMPASLPQQQDRYARRPALVAALAIAAAACRPAAVPEPGTAMANAAGCDGFLRATLHGGLSIDIDWQGQGLTCEGMPRPGDGGVRLRFAGHLSDAGRTRRVAVIIGIEGLARGETGRERATNITLIEEGEGRFFSTRDANDCWTDVSRQVPAHDDAGGLFALDGTVYCVSPLAELNGGSAISFTEMTFSGIVDWEPSE